MSSTLHGVGEAARAAYAAAEALRGAVRTARAEGHSWAAIGMVLGVPEQSAEQMFRELDSAAQEE